MNVFDWVDRLVLNNPPNKQVPAFCTLMCAKPSHGKSTVLQCLIAEDLIANARLVTSGIFPIHFLSKTQPSHAIIWDYKLDTHTISAEVLEKHYPQTAKKWLDTFGNRRLDELDNIYFAKSNSDACQHWLDSDRLGLLVLEELMTMRKGEPNLVDECVMMRRANTTGIGGRIIATTQRLHNIPMSMRSANDLLLIGKQEEEIDINAARNWIGKDLASQLPNLKAGQWITGGKKLVDFTQKK